MGSCCEASAPTPDASQAARATAKADTLASSGTAAAATAGAAATATAAAAATSSAPAKPAAAAAATSSSTADPQPGATEAPSAQPMAIAKSRSIIETDYNVEKTIGKGGSCTVVQATPKAEPDKKLAIKIMSKQKDNTKRLYGHEVDLLTGLEHPHVIEMKGHEEDEYNYYILTKLCEGGELFERIVGYDYEITEQVASMLIKDMLEALKYVHSRGIVHRDIKPDNFVFVSPSNYDNITLIDFGVARRVADDDEVAGLAGTVYYLAPELAVKRGPVPKTGKWLRIADIWSLGVVAYVMMTGRPPFGRAGQSNKEIFTQIVRQKLKFPEDVELSDSFKDFMRKVLEKNPHKRITIEAAIRHPWVQGISAHEFRLNKEVIKYLRQFTYQSRLKKAIASALAENMHHKPEREVRKHFERLDKDGDEYLDEGELVQLLSDLGYEAGKAQSEAREIIANHDLNHDGKIDFNEFKSAWQRRLLTASDKYCRNIFAVFDDNGDGYLDARELQSVLGEREKIPADALYAMIAEVDANGDGRVSYEEFAAAMKEDVASGKVDFGLMVGGANVPHMCDLASNEPGDVTHQGDDQKEAE